MYKRNIEALTLTLTLTAKHGLERLAGYWQVWISTRCPTASST